MNDFSWLSEPFCLCESESFDIEEYKKLEKEVYNYFLRELKEKELFFNGKKVFLDLRISKEWDKEESFVHITTKENKDKYSYLNQQVRLPDIHRMKKICWIRDIIINHERPEILKWSEEPRLAEGERKKYLKTTVYLWLKQRDYLVVLRDFNDVYKLVTGFSVDYESTRNSLNKKYKKACKRGL